MFVQFSGQFTRNSSHIRIPLLLEKIGQNEGKGKGVCLYSLIYFDGKLYYIRLIACRSLDNVQQKAGIYHEDVLIRQGKHFCQFIELHGVLPEPWSDFPDASRDPDR